MSVSVRQGLVSYVGGAFNLPGAYSASDFSVASYGAGGSEISWNHHAPAIVTDQINVVKNANGTMTVLGLQLSDSDANASTEGFTLSATTEEAGSGSTVTPSGSGGSLTAINGVLATGAAYNPGAAPPLSPRKGAPEAVVRRSSMFWRETILRKARSCIRSRRDRSDGAHPLGRQRQRLRSSDHRTK